MQNFSDEPYSAVCLGEVYEKGHGVPRDEAYASQLYVLAAEAGNLEGIIRLAKCYLNGRGVEPDVATAVELLESARQKDDPRAWTQFGYLFATGQIPSSDAERSSFECYERAAELGNPDAQAYCGECYAMGINCEPDLERAIPWLESAVEAGIPRAKYILACLKAAGKGMKKDIRSARRLCEEAALEGEPGAQWMLGLMLERGDGMPAEFEKAVEWYACAARQGHSDAIERLDRLREQGWEIPEFDDDPTTANGDEGE